MVPSTHGRNKETCTNNLTADTVKENLLPPLLMSLRCAHATQTPWQQNIYCSTANYMMLWGRTCGQNNADIMTVEHLLQHCQLHDALRWDMWPEQRRHHDCWTSTAALPTTWCSEAGHVARTTQTSWLQNIYCSTAHYMMLWGRTCGLNWYHWRKSSRATWRS